MTDTTLTYEDNNLERWERENAFDNQHWLAAKACIAKGDKAHAKAKDFYISAGQHLKALKAAHDERGHTWAAWESLLKEKCGIGKSRASELMQIADGTKTVEQTRDRSNESSGKSHAKARLLVAGFEEIQRLADIGTRSPLISGENSGNVETVTTSIDNQPAKKATRGAEVPPEVAELRARSAAKIRALLDENELIAAEIEKEAEPAAPDEELTLLREFARFVLDHTMSTANSKDQPEFMALRGKVRAMLGGTP